MAKGQKAIEYEAINYYIEPHTLKDTCKKFHIGEKRLKDILASNSIPIRKAGELATKSFFNESFFTQQSEGLAYFLGLMASDGCIAQNSNQIYIELESSDGLILEKLREEMELTREIKYYTTKRGYSSAKLYIENKKLKSLLIEKYGLCPNKTYDIENFHFPADVLEEKYWKDYIRGYFDGDGCIKVTNGALTFQIDGTNYTLLNFIKDYLNTVLQTNISIIKDAAPQVRTSNHDRTIDCYRIYCYRKDAEKVFNFIYKKPIKFYLERKLNKFIEGIKNGN